MHAKILMEYIPEVRKNIWLALCNYLEDSIITKKCEDKAGYDAETLSHLPALLKGCHKVDRNPETGNQQFTNIEGDE